MLLLSWFIYLFIYFFAVSLIVARYDLELNLFGCWQSAKAPAFIEMLTLANDHLFNCI